MLERIVVVVEVDIAEAGADGAEEEIDIVVVEEEVDIVVFGEEEGGTVVVEVYTAVEVVDIVVADNIRVED